MLDQVEKNMEFSRMTIGDVEALVGKKATHVEVRNKWITMTFSHPATEKATLRADIHVSVRKW